MSRLVAEVQNAMVDGRLRWREAFYILACAMPPSPERQAMIDLVVLADRQEQIRIAQVQAQIDLTGIPQIPRAA